MRRHLPLLLAGVAGLLGASPPDPLGLPDPPVRGFTLENGLRVVLHEDHRAPRVVVHALVQAGAGDETPGQEGLAHLAEHLWVEPTAHSDGHSVDALVTAVGGEMNAWTDLDATGFWMTVPSPSLDTALFALSDRMADPTGGLDAAIVQRERDVLVAEQAQRLEGPHKRDVIALARSLWPEGHPYGRAVVGTRSSLLRLRLEDVAGFFERYYTPSRTSLVLAGDLDPETAETSVRRWFSDVPARTPAPHADASAPSLGSEARRVLPSPDASPALYVAWRTVPWGDPDEPALDAAARILSSGRGTRLDDRLRGGRGLAEQVLAWTDNGRWGGSFAIGIAASKTPLDRLLALVDDEIARLAADGPTDDEMARLQGAAIGESLRGQESLVRRAETLNLCIARTGHPDCLAEDLRAAGSLTPAAVRAAVTRWLDPTRRVVLCVTSGEPLEASTPLELPR